MITVVLVDAVKEVSNIVEARFLGNYINFRELVFSKGK